MAAFTQIQIYLEKFTPSPKMKKFHITPGCNMIICFDILNIASATELFFDNKVALDV